MPSPYVPSAENLAARDALTGSSFGLWIDWTLGGPERTVRSGGSAGFGGGSAADDMKSKAAAFTASGFDARQWAEHAQNSGAGFIIFTARSADGFAFFRTRHSEWDVVDATPYGHDVLAELADACDRAGVMLLARYVWGEPAASRAEVRSMIQRYPTLAGVWIDGPWDEAPGGVAGKAARIVETLNPVRPGKTAADPERPAKLLLTTLSRLEAEERAAQEATTGDAKKKAGTAESKSEDSVIETRTAMSAAAAGLIRTLVRGAGGGGGGAGGGAGEAATGAGLAVRIEPRADGSLDPSDLEPLAEAGAWIERNGSSVIGTRPGPVLPGAWGVSTARGREVFIHYLAGKPGRLSLPRSIGDVRAAWLFSSGAAVDIERREEFYDIELNERVMGPLDSLDPLARLDTIIVLEIRP